MHHIPNVLTVPGLAPPWPGADQRSARGGSRQPPVTRFFLTSAVGGAY